MSSQLKSVEEDQFNSFLLDLKKNGYIKEIHYEHESFSLSSTVYYERKKQLKTKVKVTQATLLREHIYTPDFIVEWDESAMDIFISQDHSTPLSVTTDLMSYIEVKGNFDQNNMTRLFKLNQKWVYQKYGIYVQLVKMPSFLSKVYVPNSIKKDMYYKRGKKKGQSKLKKILSLNEFINEKQNTKVLSSKVIKQ